MQPDTATAGFTAATPSVEFTPQTGDKGPTKGLECPVSTPLGGSPGPTGPNAPRLIATGHVGKEKAILAVCGDIITVTLSVDKEHVFLQVENDQENLMVAIPAFAVPWIKYAADKLQKAAA